MCAASTGIFFFFQQPLFHIPSFKDKSLSLNLSPFISSDWVAPGHVPSEQLPDNWPWTTYTLESSSVSPGKGHMLWSLAFYVGAGNPNLGAYTFVVSIYQQSRLPVSTF